MEVLASRVLLRPVDFDRSQAFYTSALELPVYRQFGSGDAQGTVYFLGGGFLELSGRATEAAGPNVMLWLQVRDLAATHARLRERAVPVLDPPSRRPWGLDEMWIADPDGIRIAVVEVPDDHPLRRDLRPPAR
jgi:catechol 2,3-dioxygenase-like lactoylglutathione lyase family enzyme